MNEIAPNVISDGIPYVIKILNMIGPFLGGLGIIITALLAVITYFFIHQRTTETSWVESFRVLYGEFWKDDEITQVRRWITNSLEYEILEETLKIRMKNDDGNYLSEEDNNTLENLDRFCSVMMRIKYFGQMKMTKRQRELYRETYESFWRKKINERVLLRDYINRYWPGLSRWLHTENNNTRNRCSRNNVSMW